MTKNSTTPKFSDGFESAMRQRVAQAAAPEAAELLARKDVRRDYTGREERAPAEAFNPRVAEKARHKAIKAAETGDAIEQLRDHMSQGSAIRSINSKNGNRGLTLDK